MSEKRILFQDVINEKTLKDGTIVKRVIRGEIYYRKGGVNYATYKMLERGYYFSVTPERIEEKDFSQVRQVIAFTGKYIFLSEAKRFSQKTLDSLVPPATDVEQMKALALEVINRELEAEAGQEGTS